MTREELIEANMQGLEYGYRLRDAERAVCAPEMAETVEAVAKALFDHDQNAPSVFRQEANRLVFGHAGPISWGLITSDKVFPMAAEEWRAKARVALIAQILAQPSGERT